MNLESRLTELRSRLSECTNYYHGTVPLCAAENVISDFCKIPLSGDFQERYIMGSPYNYSMEGNFIGSQTLLPFYTMIHEECQILFNAHYADARTLTGMNCLTVLLMSLTSLNDRIAILPAAWGGHPSVQPICERLGLQVFQLPYDHAKWDIDYERANELIHREKIRYILLAPSDIIHPLEVEAFDLENRVLLYDISQVLGLMAGGTIPCPIHLKGTVLFGGTHKTLPGPASGLIMTNDEDLHQQMEKNINPKFLRHTQMHQVISLLFALLEAEYCGKEYTKAIVSTANELGHCLESRGFHLAKTNESYSETHQIFILCSPEIMSRISKNALRHGVTLNKKEKSLFSNTGIRLGVQEIARYGWSGQALGLIADILAELREEFPNSGKISRLIEDLPQKTVQFTFPSRVHQEISSSLHQKQI